MRAAYIEETGPVENIKVGDLPNPVAKPGQAIVKINATGLNPIDLYVRSGLVAMPMAFPYVICGDFAGVYESAAPGTSKSKFKPGDRVWGSSQGLVGRPGVTSEYAAIDEDWLFPTPSNYSDQEAAALALTGITAHIGLFRLAKLAAGEVVYVPGGSGGVGSMVIQQAKAAGAIVATTAGSAERVELCRSLGADLALNYKDDNVPEKLREFAPDGIDVWYETQREPNLEISVPLLRKRGRMILMAGRAAKPALPLGSFYPRDCSILGFAVFNSNAQEQGIAATELVKWAEAGKLKPLVGKVFPLGEAAEAQRFLEANTINKAGTLAGKVVIDLT